ncbi:MAG TPA: PspA/IM30 family protein [Peptococcaceae bacterium]|nr:PspA/IM30 family protein [Peptococcaceae bacterium]
MAIFSRLADLLKANINGLLDKAEDPEKMLKQMIIDMEEQLQKAIQGLGQVMANERQMRKQIETAEGQSKMWEERAKTALKAGEQDLAKKAVEEKLRFDENIKQYRAMHAQLENQVNAMRDQVNNLKAKLEDARNRQTLLLARAQMAEARRSISETLGGVDSDGAFAKMEKFERKIAQMEAQADAALEIAGWEGNDEDPFAKLEKQNAADEELARLMREITKE